MSVDNRKSSLRKVSRSKHFTRTAKQDWALFVRGKNSDTSGFSLRWVSAMIDTMPLFS
ncbi:MAG: hypothetical protein OEN20_10340 [Gammaproteobacteria bacterium]|nr:hypothetical protein [Gammaproteobacteria bacterium]